MKRILVAVLALLGFGAMASVAQAAETLMVAPYPANPPWKNITDKANDEQKLLEWIPADQNENAINDILTEQVFYKLKNADPAMLIGSIFKSSAQACDRIRVNGPIRQTESGYPVAYAQIYCGHQKGTTIDVDIFIKAIGGHDAMYVVQREFHRPVAPGGVPGVISFAKNQGAQMRAFMAARTVANDYLVSKTKLCANAGCTGH
jgi:hypothetical protein